MENRNELEILKTLTREELLEKAEYQIKSLKNYTEGDKNADYLRKALSNILTVLKTK